MKGEPLYSFLTASVFAHYRYTTMLPIMMQNLAQAKATNIKTMLTSTTSLFSWCTVLPGANATVKSIAPCCTEYNRLLWLPVF